MTSILAAEETVNPLIPHPIEIILSLIVFGILFYVVRTWVAPRFEKAFAERAEAIEGGLKRAEETQAEAKAALEQYQQQLAEARHEASRIREEAKEQGAAIVAEMREQAQAEAQRIVTQAHTQLEAERQQTLLQLRSEIGDLSTQLAGRIVGEALEDEGRQRRIVERFITELEQQPVGEAR
ncbi:F-type H+-transporting ATPase subunit b [Actinopolymorpha cephalotaxi]|uniref:ATP synthase subunit b n=1 Tax=Actinopolymorpha cephalotaxi TaxID=504797 RepID=A0A1I2ZDM3_9ACTN|nr:F0F1 ATP synthase subunit B [Actinopolymorpha cephalotaxi]NYH81930.1 F-type H+-transporting ATPase subunit b [Actinopolymorpha cephalotaxi]SFH35972.1 F-type H+-transporting ATPase subunit b [Actinopolymorpha cephalotaxi]